MIKIRKISLFLLLLSLSLILLSCSTTVKDSGTAKQSDSVASIEENKDKSATSETSVDLKAYDLADKNDHGSSIMSGLNIFNGRTKFFFTKFSGVRTVATLKKDTTFDYESALESGKLNIVIQDSDYNILKVIEAKEKGTITLDFGDTNKYIIRAVGDKANKGNVIIIVR